MFVRASLRGDTCLGTAVCCMLTVAASGHVALDDPNGGETLDAGSVFTITWHVAVQHDTVDWDLWYSTDSPAGPWTEIAMDLPAGDIAVNAVHLFDWTVPAATADSAWVRVRQDNTGTDYEDVSDGAFSIVGGCPWDVDGDGGVGVVDMLDLLGSWTQEGVPADFDGGGVGVTDLLAMLSNWGGCP